MRKQTTTYSCDSCGATVATKRDLRGFRIESLAPNGTIEEAVRADVCEKCELGAIEVLRDLVLQNEDAVQRVDGWRRLGAE